VIKVRRAAATAYQIRRTPEHRLLSELGWPSRSLPSGPLAIALQGAAPLASMTMPPSTVPEQLANSVYGETPIRSRFCACLGRVSRSVRNTRAPTSVEVCVSSAVFRDGTYRRCVPFSALDHSRPAQRFQYASVETIVLVFVSCGPNGADSVGLWSPLAVAPDGGSRRIEPWTVYRGGVELPGNFQREACATGDGWRCCWPTTRAARDGQANHTADYPARGHGLPSPAAGPSRRRAATPYYGYASSFGDLSGGKPTLPCWAFRGQSISFVDIRSFGWRCSLQRWQRDACDQHRRWIRCKRNGAVAWHRGRYALVTEVADTHSGQFSYRPEMTSPSVSRECPWHSEDSASSKVERHK